MTHQPSLIAHELFLRAIADGSVEVPAPLQQLLDELDANPGKAIVVETVDLERRVAAEYLTPESLHSQTNFKLTQPDRCENALRWVLRELQAWKPETTQAERRLQVLIASLLAFDFDNAGIDAVLDQLKDFPLEQGLLQLLMQAAAPQIPLGSRTDQWRQEVLQAGRSGDCERLRVLMRHLQLRLPEDVQLTIYLLWRLRPDLLALSIRQKSDPVFCQAVCLVLGDSATKFAIGVDDIAFKFMSAISVAGRRPADAGERSVEAFRELLLQVAKSPHWHSWLRACYSRPAGDNVAEQALSEALGQLEPEHWEDFLAAVELETSRNTAGPVADILVRFHKLVGDARTAGMWRSAFRRWDDWDYGRGVERNYLFSPVTCALDLAVAMYYAKLSAEEAKAEESRLREAINFIEQEWFSSVTDLITHHNRLLSRLRLVCHGQALASGAMPCLPPKAVPDGAYARSRYHYVDMGAR